ncbi:16S rRNA (uracil(1498)-N(3))-methyltransferase [Georgenia thermotolerans]|uniref:Ribosomal RNA small subunit methyltransferase E n=1 Tax=Georgenia thermotolerans TaxID=527326 RepID=A0A7J5UQ38_9MICO|nr:16S rRNA (uracil(1498)-N(3))-methyltransferase [Georgenia thermotolerans]KAE8764525.1 16S rRNA (uracil(1498)-N(3))-methyltransferase [Georgenia thermotolerans]
MTTAVFHAAGLLDGVSPGAVVTLTGAEARHAATVRRLRPGEAVDLVDGAGLRAGGTVTAAAKDALSVAVDRVTREPAPPVRLVLVQALAKGGRDEQAVETATELGVDAVVPWQADRSVSVWSGAKVARGRERWAAVALAAAKQSRRAWVPEVREPVPTTRLVAVVGESVGGGGAVLVLHEQATTPLAAAHLPAVPAGPATGAAGEAPAPGDGAPEVLVVVGPEGGITDAEVAALEAAGAQPVLLGPHVLRTSTAGPAALAVLAQRLGRWG